MASTFLIHDDAWKAAMDHGIQATVTLHQATPFSFGDHERGSIQATGFVVDTDIGIILTNRHMVSEGPMHARAVFQIGACQGRVVPIYIHPVHDYAFCKYNLEDVRGLSLKPIRLQPEMATVGRKIRVLGNDTGRVMSILPGVISRVDCNPPHWDSGINYIQASADVAGGSSGSAVIAQNGSAVAMVSGGYILSSTDVYLPLDLPLRTLQALRLGQLIPRGTIQSIWELEKPADCHARGLSYEEVLEYSHDSSGLLVAKEILPDGPSDTHVKEGDILRAVDGRNVTSLLQFEQLIDGAVGNTLSLQVWRHGNTLEFKLQVQDLGTLTPYRLLEYAGSVFQDLRYQIAFAYNVPIKGVVLSDAGGSFILKDPGVAMIRSLNNQSTPDLTTFIEVAREIPNQAKVSVEYRILDGNSPCLRYESITIDRSWLREKMVLRSREDNDMASWYIRDLGPAPTAATLPTQTLPTKPIAECYPVVHKISSNMVMVLAWTPYTTDGACTEYLECGGLVINANRGFVVTARSFIPSTMCTLRIRFADSIEVPATKIYDHALGFTVVQYDTSLVQGQMERVTFSKREPKAQDKMTIYGPIIDGDGSGSGLVPTETTVSSIGPLTGYYDCKRFYHPINVDILHFPKAKFGGAGVLLDEHGDLQGLWLPFFINHTTKWVGVQLSLLLPAFEKLQRGTLPPECRMLDVELELVHGHEVQAFGVSEARNFTRAKTVSCSHQNGLEAGDIIVKQGGNPVTLMSDLSNMFTHESVRMSVIRRQVEIDVDVPTITVSSRQSDRIVWFAGAQFEPPYSPVPFCTRKLYSQIFVTNIRTGSPADEYRVRLCCFVTEVQGVATVNFDDFTEQIKKLPDDQFCQITLVDLQGCPETVSLMTSRRDFKAIDARKEGSPHGWRFQEL